MATQAPKTGVILMNLGTPDALSKSSYRKFLRAFLSDQRVVELPAWLWRPILNGIVLPLRAGKVLEAYREIWTEEGSPLTAITRQQVAALQTQLQEQFGERAPLVSYAMTYSQPLLAEKVIELREQGVDQLFILPLYPQYSGTTTASIYDQYAKFIQQQRDIPDIRMRKHYCDHPDYIRALADSVRTYWEINGRAERLLLSYHGIPKRCVDNGDPYLEQCQRTSALLMEELQLPQSEWGMSFQSRFGRLEWLQPYTVNTLENWAKDGLKTVDVLCPAFAADCLETLEEIAIGAAEEFCAAGGEKLRLIPCLNANPAHIDLLSSLVAENFRLSPQ